MTELRSHYETLTIASLHKPQIQPVDHASDGRTDDKGITSIGSSRNSRARRDIKDWLKRAGLPYHSPHKFRHGHAVYGLKNAKDISALKAVSQNLMHANLSITDGIYAILSTADVREKMRTIGNSRPIHKKNQREFLGELINELIEKLNELPE